MKKHIEIHYDQSLKGIEGRFCALPFKDKGIVKISQRQKHIFTLYNVDNEVGQGKVHLPSKFCQLNGIEEGRGTVQIYMTEIDCEGLQAHVNALDWQIINKKSVRIQDEFLNQIQVAWPSAALPLYYDRNNYVVLRIQCRDVVVLRQNTKIQIVQEREQQEQAKEVQRVQVDSVQFRQTHLNKFGNINTCMLPYNKQGMQYRLLIDEVFPYVRESRQPKQYLQLIKQKENKDIKHRLKLRVIRGKQQEYSINEYMHSYYSMKNRIVKVQARVVDNNSRGNQFTLQFLIQNCKDFKLVISTISKSTNIVDKFVSMLIDWLCEHGYIDIYDNFPFLIDEHICYITIHHNNSTLNHIVIKHSEGVSTQDVMRRVCVQQLEDDVKVHRIVGMKETIRIGHQLKQFIRVYQNIYQNQINKIYSNFIDTNFQNMIVSSIRNNGKTILYRIMQEMGIPCTYINFYRVQDSSLNSADVCLYMQSVFQTVTPHAIVFIDNFDALCYDVDEGDLHRRQQRLASKIILRKLMKLIFIYKRKVILTVKKESNIDQEFPKSQFMSLQIRNPTHEQRQKCVQVYEFKGREVDKGVMVSESQSMSFGEFYQFMKTGKKNERQMIEKGELNFSKIAGLRQAKIKLKDMIEKPFKYSFMFKNLPIKLSRGILLYGASGCGKSMIGHSLQGQFKMKYFNIKGSDILSKYIGGSEAAVRDIFQKAMSVSPSIIFFDEFETIVPRRNSSNTGVTDRVVNQFLCYLDGVASMEGVFIVAASSRPDLIDPALLRPGRIDNHIFLEYPSDQQKLQLLKIYKNSVNIQVDESQILQQTRHYSYSDLVGILKELRIKKSVVLLSENKGYENYKDIDEGLFRKVVQDFSISVREDEQRRQEKMFLKFKNGDPIDMKSQKLVLN